MVKLPPPFIATKYPGYFWNKESKVLYSLKVNGVLHPMKKAYPNHYNYLSEPGYRISVNGIKKFFPMSYLEKLEDKDSEIPILEKKNDGNI